MFGYVRAVKDILPPEEKKRYEGVYCGLCRTLGERYGKRAQLTLNYDFVFLAMLLSDGEPEETLTHCPLRPWRKKDALLCGSAMELAADESVILTWWKLQDAVADDKGKKALAARAAASSLKSAYRKAAALHPDFDRTVQDCLSELQEMEREKLPSLDRPADTFARILRAAGTESSLAARTHATEQILYHVGRWIYLADAWDDLEEDAESGSYNPVLARFGETAKEQADYLRQTMHVSLGLAGTAFSLLDWGEWEPLLGHILKIGLPAVEEAVFTGQWKNRNKRNKRRDNRHKETGV